MAVYRQKLSGALCECLQLCDGSSEEEVQQLHEWIVEHLPGLDWDGDEGGISIWAPGQEIEDALRVPQYDWIVVPPQGVLSVSAEEFESLYEVA